MATCKFTSPDVTSSASHSSHHTLVTAGTSETVGRLLHTSHHVEPMTTEETWPTYISLDQTEEVADYHKPLFYIRIIIVLFGLLGIAGNALSLLIIFRFSAVRAKLGITFIMHQCLVDLIASTLLVITYLVIMLNKVFVGVGGEIVCRIFISEGPLWTCFNVSTVNLVALTIERYFKIVHSVSHKQRFNRTKAFIVIGCIWFFNCLYKLPATVGTTGTKGDECVFQAFWPSRELQRAFGISTFFLLYFTPLIVFVVCYTHIMAIVRKTSMAVANHAPVSASGTSTSTNPGDSNKLTKGQVEILKTLLLVAVGFIICWTPTHVHYLLYNLGMPLSFSDGLYYFTMLLSIANCFINPFIYLAKFKDFKLGLSAVLCRCLE